MQNFAGTDRITVRQRLGAGGFGVVYQGFDRERRIPVAIKTLRSLDPGGLARFKDEFRSLAYIAHPNLITLYELMSDGDQWFFTMELVDGVDFLTWVRGQAEWAQDTPGSESSEAETTAVDEITVTDGRPREATLAPPALDPLRLRDALSQLASGVEALHAVGIVHLDIKPSNVLVTPAGRVVLLDFGLALEMPEGDDSAVSPESRVFGTPAYMAPERMQRTGAGPPSDWYAVGVMLYEALTGRRPYTGTLLEQLMAQQQSEPLAPRELVSSVPADLDALCCDLLKRDPDDRPTGRAIVERLGSGRHAGTAGPPPRSRVFVGREPETEALEAAYDATRAGEPVLVSISGAPGVGKSALARRFVERLAARDPTAVVLSGRCYETESLPYKVVDSVLDALSRHLQRLPIEESAAVLPREVGALARVFPVLGSVPAVVKAQRRTVDIADAQELRRRAFGALRELLGRFTDRYSLAIVIDDVHWGDVDSASLIAELLRPPDAPAILLILTYRSGETARSPLLRELTALVAGMPTLDTREVPLTELAPDEARDLATRLVGGRGGAEHVAGESGGNPLFIAELARHQREPGAGGAAAPGATLEAVIAARVATLPPPARQLLDVVALSGYPISVAAAFEAAGGQNVDDRALGLLRSARLIQGSGDGRRRRIEPYHDRIREVVSEGLAPDQARALHLRIADALGADADPDPERLAFHFERAGATDRAVPHVLDSAARAADGLAFDHAAALYARAIALRPPSDPAERRLLYERLGSALASAGRGVKAAEAFLQAERDAPPAAALDLRRRAAHEYLTTGQIDEGMDVLRSGLAAVGLRMPATPRRALFALLYNRFRLRLRGLEFERRDEALVPVETLQRLDMCWAAAVGLTNFDPILGHVFHSRHMRMALEAGEPGRVARSLSILVSQVAMPGSGAQREVDVLMAKADALAQGFDDPHVQALNDLACGVAEYLLGHFKRSLVRLDRAETALRDRCVGIGWDLNFCYLWQLRTLFVVGDIAEMCARAPRLIDEARERGDRLATATLRARVAYSALLAADQPAAAREACLEGIPEWSQRGFHTEHYFQLTALTEIDLYEGLGPAAMERVSAKWRVIRRALHTRVQVVRGQLHDLRGRAACAAALTMPTGSERQRLLAIAEKDSRTLDGEGVAWASAFAQRLRASIAIARGDDVRARAALEEAERAMLAADLVTFAMAVRRRRGTLVGGDEGGAIVGEVDAWAASQTIRDPERFFGVYCQ